MLDQFHGMVVTAFKLKVWEAILSGAAINFRLQSTRLSLSYGRPNQPSTSESRGPKVFLEVSFMLLTYER